MKLVAAQEPNQEKQGQSKSEMHISLLNTVSIEHLILSSQKVKPVGFRRKTSSDTQSPPSGRPWGCRPWQICREVESSQAGSFRDRLKPENYHSKHLDH